MKKNVVSSTHGIDLHAGLKGILAVMRSIGMLSSRSAGTSHIQPMVASSTNWVRAPGSGIPI